MAKQLTQAQNIKNFKEGLKMKEINVKGNKNKRKGTILT